MPTIRTIASIDDVFRHLAVPLKRTEAALERNLASPVPIFPVVGRHLVLSGGKRVRPSLLLLTAEALGMTGPRAIDMAVVAEYMHAATLLHDDVVDVATVRRGKPSANVLFGNSISVLVGDFLFARASELMTTRGNIDVVSVFASCLVHLSQGEVLQLMKSKDPEIAESDYRQVVHSKTASLMAASAEVGAILAEAPTTDRKRARIFGERIGMAFQLVDDLLDYTGTEKELGKAPLQDVREGKVTLPLIRALANAPAKERSAISALLRAKRRSAAETSKIARFVKQNGGLSETADSARAEIAKAKKTVDSFPDSTAKRCLITLADFVVARTK